MSIEMFLQPYQLSPEEKARYNPARDLGYVAGDLITSAFKLITDPKFVDFVQVFKVKLGVTDEQLSAAIERFAAMLAMGRVEFDKSFYRICQENGWEDVDPAARMAIQAAFGQVIFGATFYAIRDMTPGDHSISSAAYLGNVAHYYAKILSLPRWQRWLIQRFPLKVVRSYFEKRFFRAVCAEVGFSLRALSERP